MTGRRFVEFRVRAESEREALERGARRFVTGRPSGRLVWNRSLAVDSAPGYLAEHGRLYRGNGRGEYASASTGLTVTARAI